MHRSSNLNAQQYATISRFATAVRFPAGTAGALELPTSSARPHSDAVRRAIQSTRRVALTRHFSQRGSRERFRDTAAAKAHATPTGAGVTDIAWKHHVL